LQDAQQEVPAWLEEKAESSLGVGYDRGGGKFGGRDQRRGKFGDSGGDAGFGGGDSFGGGAAVSAGGGDDEDWD